MDHFIHTKNQNMTMHTPSRGNYLRIYSKKPKENQAKGQLDIGKS